MSASERADFQSISIKRCFVFFFFFKLLHLCFVSLHIWLLRVSEHHLGKYHDGVITMNSTSATITRNTIVSDAKADLVLFI